MSEPDASTTQTPDAASQGDQGGGKQFQPPESQADLDKIVSERLARQRSQYGMTPDEVRAAIAERDQLKAANQTEAERLAQDVTRWQTEAETWRGNAVKSRIETLAGDFADPTDALAAIGDPAQFLDAGGQINDEAIKTELASVLDRKPHWRKQADTPSGPRAPIPSPAQGTSGTPAALSPRDQFAAILQTPR